MIIADPHECAAALAEDNERLRQVIRQQNEQLDAMSKELYDRRYAAMWGISYERLLELDERFYAALSRNRVAQVVPPK